MKLLQSDFHLIPFPAGRIFRPFFVGLATWFYRTFYRTFFITPCGKIPKNRAIHQTTKKALF